MEVILAKRAGFCFGVKRATQLAFEAAEKEGDTYTLGPIIHSPQVVERLQEMGVRVLSDLEGVSEGTVIIRSHGVTAGELEEAVSRELAVVDATCPFVKKAQEHVRTLSEAGYDVVVVGDDHHPEVQGIVSYASGRVFVVASGAEAKALPAMARIGVVAQTTQSFENLQQVVAACLRKGGEIRVYNTICDATSVRQEEARELAARVDSMVVIGGFNSANTCRLAELCAEIQPRTHHIETEEELEPAWFDGCSSVGVTAGASTPKWLIDRVVARLREMK
jgi:4-hydroxy-3-methylbut-2-enyl diphosphate reductase